MLEPSLPRVARVPRGHESDGADACFLAAGYGLTPDQWQEDILDAWLSRRRDGRWSAATCGLAVPRQNGKNALIEVRELFGMIMLGEKFLHTAHQVKTARKAFKRILSFFENEREHPELAALVKEIRRTNSQEAIVLKNGGSVEFVARTRSSGRGFTVDVLVLDEAQDLDDDALEALQPTISAAPLGNPQTIFTGTPPNPELNQTGEVFIRVRKNGESGRDPRLCWFDYGVEDGPMPDIDNRDLWLATNPALGDRLGVSEVEGEHMLMSPEGFARERLGWWGDGNTGLSDIDQRAWAECRDDDSTITSSRTLGVDVNLDHSWACISGAGKRDDGLPSVEDIVHDRGTGWVVRRVKELLDKHGRIPVAIDARSPAASLIPDFEAAGIEVLKLTTADVTQACGWLFSAINDRAIRHCGSDLDKAVAGAIKRNVGDAFAWGRKQSVADITPLNSATWALAAMNLDLGPITDAGVWTF